MSILIVDDNAINRRILQLYLERAGYSAVFAESGREALALLASTPNVDLMVTDIRMPEMDGWELISEVRRSAEWSALPIIVSSAYADVGAVEKAKEHDIKTFVVKPINAEYLTREIRTALAGAGPCLTPGRVVMTRLNLEREEYYALVWDLSGEVERTTTLIESMLNAYPIDLAAEGAELGQFMDLRESCHIMGADRVVTLLSRLIDDGGNDPAGTLRALLRECRLLHDAVAARLAELDAEREREVEHELTRSQKRAREASVSNSLSDVLQEVRAIANVATIAGGVLARAGMGVVQSVVPNGSPGDLGLEFAVWVPVALPGKHRWVDLLMAMNVASATALFTAALGDQQAPDDDLREMLRESMNFLQGSLKAALEAEFVEYVVPKIPKAVRVSDVLAPASGAERRARWNVTLEGGTAHILAIERAMETAARFPEDLQVFDVVAYDVPDLIEPGAVLAEGGAMLDEPSIARIRERAAGASITVLEASSFARMLATR